MWPKLIIKFLSELQEWQPINNWFSLVPKAVVGCFTPFVSKKIKLTSKMISPQGKDQQCLRPRRHFIHWILFTTMQYVMLNQRDAVKKQIR